jgi:hypothetical protein
MKRTKMIVCFYYFGKLTGCKANKRIRKFRAGCLVCGRLHSQGSIELRDFCGYSWQQTGQPFVQPAAPCVIAIHFYTSMESKGQALKERNSTAQRLALG